MRTLLLKNKTHWTDSVYVRTSIIGIAYFFASLVINYLSLVYATNEAGGAVTDILLDHLPVINTDIVFSEGAIIFVIFLFVNAFLRPKTVPFSLKSIALFITVRSIFVIMTHLGPSLVRITTDLDKIGKFASSGADLFFSGHTGLPYLMALLFWQNIRLRNFFLFSSIVAAVAVILGHLHYTIDVFSAFFITFGVYHISLKLFPEDQALFNEDV